MFNEDEAREKLAQLARIFAMQGMLGLFGHLSVYDPDKKRLFITPGMGSDKALLRPEVRGRGSAPPPPRGWAPARPRRTPPGAGPPAGRMADPHRAPRRARRR